MEEYWSDGFPINPLLHHSNTPVFNFCVLQHFITPIFLDIHYHDAFGFEVVVQGFGAVLTAEATGFDAAKGELVVAVMK
jgi:hypothetical protein